MSLPYKGPVGEAILNKLRKQLINLLPKEIKPRFSYTGKKLGSYFCIKDAIKKEHLTNLVYAFFHNPKSIEYVGETNVRFETRTHEHCFTDKRSAIFKNASYNKITLNQNNFRVLEAGFNKTVDRKIAEALYIKEHKPPLNEQIKNFNLKLFI